MQLTLNLKKSLEETANEYFERSKKSRRKIEGAVEAIARFKTELEKLELKQQKKEQQKEEQKKKSAEKSIDWFEKFRWFISSEGFLCIGGRDATTNEVIIKKHVEENDLIFHAEMAGSPFFVIKTEGKSPKEASIQETADATALYSRAWKTGLASVEVFQVKKEQVSKKAPSGEFMQKGSFMISGKRIIHQGKMDAGVGKLESGKIMCAPISAIKANCKEFAIILQGKGKPSDCAKKIARKLKSDVDDVLRVLPAGSCEVKQ